MPDIITVTPYTAIDHVIIVENLQPGRVNQADSGSRYPAGKGVNVARAVTSLGEHVAVLGLVGAESAAVFSKLRSELMEVRLRKVPGETRTNISLSDRSQETTTHIRTPGFTVTHEDMERLTGDIRSLARGGDIVVLAGSLPPGADDATYGRLTEACHTTGARVILDASGSALREGLQAKPFMIKPNVSELKELVGADITGPGEIVNAAREVTRSGISLVIVSRGAAGAIAVSEKGEIWSARVSAVDDSPVNNVGCGDALVGGVAVGLAQNRVPADLLQLGVVCGTANLFTRVPGLCDPEMLEKFRSLVSLEQLAVGSKQ